MVGAPMALGNSIPFINDNEDVTARLIIEMCLVFIMHVFFLFMAALAAYRSSRAKGQIRAAGAGLHHSHSNTRSTPNL